MLAAIADVDVSQDPPDVTFEYDGDGRRVAVHDRYGTETYRSDTGGRLVGIARGDETTLAYEYDATGRITRRTYADGTTVDYGYTDGLLTSVTEEGRTTTLSYDPSGHLERRTLPNGLMEARGYDAAGRLVRIRTVDGADVVEDLRYTLDPVGNPTSLETVDRVESYEYDAKNQLTAACGGATCSGSPASYVRYEYDAVGNRLREERPSVTTTYAYDAGGQLTREVRGSEEITYEHDPDGNMIRRGGVRYAYDAAGRQVAVVDGTVVHSYGYDGDGKRLEAETSLLSGVTVEERFFLWDPTFEVPELVLERDDRGQTIRGYVQTDGGPLTVVDGGERFSYHADRIGSTTHVSDASGNVDLSYEYERLRRHPRVEPPRPGCRPREPLPVRRRVPRPRDGPVPPAGPPVRARAGPLHRPRPPRGPGRRAPRVTVRLRQQPPERDGRPNGRACQDVGIRRYRQPALPGG